VKVATVSRTTNTWTISQSTATRGEMRRATHGVVVSRTPTPAKKNDRIVTPTRA
jgi:hypothetical protein